jgi:DNA-binding GntR family transcriptional regulator
MQTNRGAVVRELDRDALRQIYQIRGALEGLAASLAAGKITAGDAAAMRSLAQAVPAPEAEGYAEACWTFDVALHGLIAERSGNALLAAEIRRNVDLVQLVRTRVGARPGFLAQAYQQHLEILAAVESGDRRAARQTMTRHIRDAARVAARVALVELKSRSVRRSSSR